MGVFVCIVAVFNKNLNFMLLLSHVQINTADYSSSQWVTCFQDTAVEILGCSAQELGDLRDQDSPDYNNAFQRANFKDYIFRVRAKMDNYNVSCVQVLLIKML